MSLPRLSIRAGKPIFPAVREFFPYSMVVLPVIRVPINPYAIISQGVETRQEHRKAKHSPSFWLFHVNVHKDFVRLIRIPGFTSTVLPFPTLRHPEI